MNIDFNITLAFLLLVALVVSGSLHLMTLNSHKKLRLELTKQTACLKLLTTINYGIHSESFIDTAGIGDVIKVNTILDLPYWPCLCGERTNWPSSLSESAHKSEWFLKVPDLREYTVKQITGYVWCRSIGGTAYVREIDLGKFPPMIISVLESLRQTDPNLLNDVLWILGRALLADLENSAYHMEHASLS